MPKKLINFFLNNKKTLKKNLTLDDFLKKKNQFEEKITTKTLDFNMITDLECTDYRKMRSGEIFFTKTTEDKKIKTYFLGNSSLKEDLNYTNILNIKIPKLSESEIKNRQNDKFYSIERIKKRIRNRLRRGRTDNFFLEREIYQIERQPIETPAEIAEKKKFDNIPFFRKFIFKKKGYTNIFIRNKIFINLFIKQNALYNTMPLYDVIPNIKKKKYIKDSLIKLLNEKKTMFDTVFNIKRKKITIKEPLNIFKNKQYFLKKNPQFFQKILYKRAKEYLNYYKTINARLYNKNKKRNKSK